MSLSAKSATKAVAPIRDRFIVKDADQEIRDYLDGVFDSRYWELSQDEADDLAALGRVNDEKFSSDKDKTMVHVHLVTLRNPRTEAERLIRIQTLSDRFSVVLMEIQRQRAALGLTGYEIFESLPVTEPECFSDLIAA